MCIVSGIALFTSVGVTLSTLLTDVVITGAAAAIAGGVVGTVSAVQQAENNKNQAEYQAEVAEANALLARRQAERIDLAADQRRAALLMDFQGNRGAARAGFAANGVVLGAGTVLDYEADLAQTYDLDLKNLNYDVENQKWQAKAEGASLEAQSGLYKMQAKAYGQQKITSGIGGAISTVGDTAKTVVSGIGMLSGLSGSALGKTEIGGLSRLWQKSKG
jgi:hypothetical protein